MTHLWLLDVASKHVAPPDERRVHGRQLRVVARRHADRVRSSRQRRQRQRRHRGHLDRDRGRRRRARARDAGRARTPIPSGRPTARGSRSRPAMANPSYFYTNSVHRDDPGGGRRDRARVDGVRRGSVAHRVEGHGIFFSASQRTSSYLFRLDPSTKRVTKVAPADGQVGSGVQRVGDGRGRGVHQRGRRRSSPRSTSRPGGDHAEEADEPRRADRRVGAAVARSDLLEEPGRRDDRRRAAQARRLSGGPPVSAARRHSRRADGRLAADSVREQRRSIRSTSGSARGALVLEPNYRGSAGYGEKFRSLNVRNLGVGDAWDVLSGIDALIAQGLVDRDRVGAMGWSQGGYISAFLTTHDSARFKAISVGAGISDWMTYYVNTDITPFTRQYLKATPWDDPEIYAEDVADDLHQGREDADADPARRHGPARAAAERVRALSRAAGSARAERSSSSTAGSKASATARRSPSRAGP